MREENDRDSNLKSFESKNAKVSLLNFRILKLNKFNRDDKIKTSHSYKNNEDKRKSKSKSNIKILFIFIIIKNIILNLII